MSRLLEALKPAGKRLQVLAGIAVAATAAAVGALIWLDGQLAPSIPPLQAAELPAPQEPPPAVPPEPLPVPPPEVRAALPGDLQESAAPPTEQPPRRPPEPPGPAEQDAPPPAVRRSEHVIVVHPAAAAGYAAMANGSLDAAEESYRKALSNNQGDRNALLGLAIAAQRKGNGEEAIHRYGQMLALDPRDSDANAGIALLRGALDPVAFESRLKELLAERSENAALHHALGSLLARQNRWGEAQEAFFRAVTLAPQAADYQFNLAVSLDHLGHYAQAGAYYRKALERSMPGTATFSREAAEARISAIEALRP